MNCKRKKEKLGAFFLKISRNPILLRAGADSFFYLSTKYNKIGELIVTKAILYLLKTTSEEERGIEENGIRKTNFTAKVFA